MCICLINDVNDAFAKICDVHLVVIRKAEGVPQLNTTAFLEHQEEEQLRWRRNNNKGKDQSHESIKIFQKYVSNKKTTEIKFPFKRKFLYGYSMSY